MRYNVFVIVVILASSVFTYPLQTLFAESSWQIYKLSFADKVFKMPYKITHGHLVKMETDRDVTSLFMKIQSDSISDGTLEIAVPRNLFDPIRGLGDDFAVIMNGDAVKYQEVRYTACFRSILFEFPESSQETEIVVTTVYRSAGTAVTPISIATDKDNYEVGEIIDVSGCTSLDLDDKEVVIEVLNPQHEVYKTISLSPNTDGSFSTSLVVEGEHTINGTYTAKATYADKSTASSFVVPEFPTLGLIIFATATFLMLVAGKINAKVIIQ